MIKRRFPGINPFQTEEQDRFFGRDEDIRDLHALLLMEKMVVLFGKSGHGKSSLLNAGIIPRFLHEKAGSERRYEPVVIKFGAWQAGQMPPMETARQQIKISLGEKSQIPALGLGKTLWYAAKSAGYQRILLVFDQFEEFFTYPLPQQERMADELGELLHAEMPPELAARFSGFSDAEQDFLADKMDIRAIFAIREDRLHLLDKLKYPLPAIFARRYALHPLPRTRAAEAIALPAGLPGDFDTPPFDFSPAAMTLLLDYLKDDEGRVETNHLQILAESFEARAKEELVKTFTLSNIGDLKGVVANYYRERIAIVQSPVDRLAVQKLCEEGLSQEGDPPMRLMLHEAQIRNFYGIGADLLEQLVQNRLLRAEPTGAGNGYTYELPHDTLLEPVLDAKRLRQEAEEQERLRSAQEAGEREAARLRAESRAARQRADEEMRRAEEAERLKVQAQKGQKRARVLALLAGLVALIAIALGVYAVSASQKAKKEELRAKDALGQVEKEKQATEIQRQIAVDNENLARQKEQESNYNLEKSIIANALVQASLFKVESEEKRTREALEQQKKALINVADLTMRDAKYAISQLDYKKGLDKLEQVVYLGVMDKEASEALLEIVFYYAETGKFDVAEEVLEMVLGMNNDTLFRFENLNSRIAFHDAIQKIAPGTLEKLEGKYFPRMIKIDAGEDWLGSKNVDEFPIHRVSFEPFKMAETETTWWQYNLFCEASGYKKAKPGGWEIEGNNPVMNISWFDAIAYANWLSKREGIAPSITEEGGIFKMNPYKGYRLPTESEWEYAARAGTELIYAGCNSKDDLVNIAWFEKNARSRTQSVKILKPNRWALFDMTGNLSEWCWDWYGEYPSHYTQGYSGPTDGRGRVARGGSWNDSHKSCYVSYRNNWAPDYRYTDIGFRVCAGGE